MEPCVFCLRADRPLTREHVFAHWLVLTVHAGRLVASDRSRRAAPPAAPPERIARVVARVCADCNAGWMSSLEVRFRRMLFARPRVGLLPAPDRVALSRWYAKTAVLLAQARGAVLGDARQHTKLVAGMPDDIEVFVARRRRPPQRLDFAIEMADGSDATRVESVAILVDDVIAHVAPRGTLTSRHGTKLWPLRSHILRWETLPVITWR